MSIVKFDNKNWQSVRDSFFLQFLHYDRYLKRQQYLFFLTDSPYCAAYRSPILKVVVSDLAGLAKVQHTPADLDKNFERLWKLVRK